MCVISDKLITAELADLKQVWYLENISGCRRFVNSTELTGTGTYFMHAGPRFDSQDCFMDIRIREAGGTRSKLEVAMRGQAQIMATMRADYERKISTGPEVSQEHVKKDVKEDILRDKDSPEACKLASGPKEKPNPRQRVTVEEVEDEDDPVSYKPSSGPSKDKRKNVDPRNWRNIHALQNFTDDFHARRDALANFAEIKRIKLEEITPRLSFSEEFSNKPSSPKAKKSSKRSKSPKNSTKESLGTKLVFETWKMQAMFKCAIVTDSHR
ncbi:hypothetical protein R3P38DRAFT_2805918 [Favolaschia claudopus]|uniref:Uncharacterized protein n=1 Tax=Favolaschia claudopus TaxID=2862362 RepID=A0AAV9ZLT7_9AGAR